MAARVLLSPVAADATALATPDLGPGLAALAHALGLPAQAAAKAPRWAVKLQLGAPHRPTAVPPAWTRAVAGALGGQGFLCDTLSITTAGLDTVEAHLALAAQKGYGVAAGPGAAGTWPYLVADAPDRGAPLAVAPTEAGGLAGHALAAGLAGADHLCVLTQVQPHPHLGLQGALSSVGIGLADRAATIALHRDIRPRVDTPLCAGCGVCMTVCVFDAIRLNAGRAYIDHTRCTGCGECMSVCFMAGIEPEEASGIPAFQAKVAAAAGGALARLTDRETARAVYFSFLVGLDRQVGGARRRDRSRPGDVGILASRDPVALDQAAWDLVADRAGGRLAAWSGYNQLPETLLARAAELGLGERAYDLVTV